MPTTKPRVWVTLEPEAHETLLAMAKLGNTTPGRVLSDLAGPVLPALKQLVDAANRFAAWERDLKGQVARVQGDVRQGLEAAVRELQARMEAGGGPIPSEPLLGDREPSRAGGEGAPGRASIRRSTRPGVPSKPSPVGNMTPASNTGVIRTGSERNQRVKKGGQKGGF